MTVRLLAARDLKPVSWKNGGGVTREIAVQPPGAGMDNFEWRVSTAEVASDGPFSRFDGIDRTLVILDGAGFSLTLDGAAPLRLTPDSDPLVFPADVPTSATLLAGPVGDLNIMVRRGAWSAQVERRAVEGAMTLSDEAPVCLAMILAPMSLGGVVALEAGDVIRWETGDAPILHSRGGGAIIVITLLKHPLTSRG